MKKHLFLFPNLSRLGLFFVFVASIGFFSCQKKKIEISDTEEHKQINNELGIPYFKSKSDFDASLSKLKEGKVTFDNEGWVSLEDDIRSRKLKNIPESALKAGGLDPMNVIIEDTLIMDPLLMKTVNKYREVMIDEDVFKITDLGVFKCKMNSVLDLRSLSEKQEFREKIIRIVQEIKNRKLHEKKGTLKRMALAYEEYDLGGGISYVVATDDLATELEVAPIETPVVPIETEDPNLPLLLKGDLLFSSTTSVSPTQVQIPTSTPTANMEMCDESGKTWLGEILCGVLGYSVTCHNYFRSDVRLKTVFWSQNYIVYKSVGMKVKMQNRALGIWWAEKAQELKLGWESVVINAEFQPVPTQININFDNKPYYQTVDLYNAMMEKQYKKWIYTNMPNYNKPFVELLWFMTDVPKPINEFLYKKSVSWLRDYVKKKIIDLNGPQNYDNIAVTFIQPKTITTVLLPEDPLRTSFNEHSDEFIFDYEQSTLEFGFSSTIGNSSGTNPIINITESPYNYKIVKGSKVFGIAKWNDSWRGSYVLKSED